MNVTRRELLGTVPAAMAGAWALAGQGLSARAQGASFVPAKLGVQLYTVRDQLKTLDATLGAIKAAGFDEVETLRPILGDLPPLLKKHGLAAPSGHFDAALVLDLGEGARKALGDYTFDKAVEQAKAVDMQYFVLPYLGREDRQSLDDYKRHADKMNEAGRRCRAAGLQFCYHHHSFEFVKYGDQRRLGRARLAPRQGSGRLRDRRVLAGRGRPRSGGDHPRARLAREAGAPEGSRRRRRPSSTNRRSPRPRFKEVGSGTLDFPAILRACKEVGVAHYFVEQDQVPADPLDSLKQSVTYLRSLKS